LKEFQSEGKFDLSSILQKAGNNPNNNLDFRILKCIETIDTVITNEEISVSQLSKASFLSEKQACPVYLRSS